MVISASEKNKLTESQRQILNFIKTHYEEKGVSPSYREIQESFGYKAVGTVQDHVKALIKKGYLEKAATGKGASRGLIPKGYVQEASRKVPIYGEIAAGMTRETDQVRMGTLWVSREDADDKSFALRVVGNSMIDVGIIEGDFLIVEPGSPIRNGDIVVALLDGETTVKRYEKKKGKVVLIPENRDMKPIEVTSDRFEIQGKVVGLQRKF